MTDAPLIGLSFAREAGKLLAWDDADQVYLIDADGETVASARAPGKIAAAAIGDTGTLIAALGKTAGTRLWLLDAELEPIAERSIADEPLAVSVDPHGRFVAVALRMETTRFFSRVGKPAGEFKTSQPLVHLQFVPADPLLVAASAHGSIFGVGLEPEGNSSLSAEVVWDQRLMTSVGSLTVSGDGGLILASCHTHGIQRFGAEGRSEGSYHLGGTATRAVPDFAGRSLVAATLEGELTLISRGGNVRWKTTLPRPATCLEYDALGRFLIYGTATGEIVRVDLEVTDDDRSSRSESDVAPDVGRAISAGRRGGSVRAPLWLREAVKTEEEAASLVLSVLDDPPRIAAIDRRNRLKVWTSDGNLLGQAPEFEGVGRILRGCPGWIAAATDRRIVLYDARANKARRLDLNLFSMTHLAIRPDTFGLAIVQERDRIGRAVSPDRWVWKRELNVAAEDLALGIDDLCAVSLEDGRLFVFEADGSIFAERSADAAEPPLLIEAPENAPDELAWITLIRRAQTLRGHARDGEILWETPVPWEAWRLLRDGPCALAIAPDGRSLAYDAAGKPIAQSRDGEPRAEYGRDPAGRPLRFVNQGMNLICSDLSGRSLWRAVSAEPIGPLAVGASGLAAVFGKSIAWFPAENAPSEN